MLADSTVLIVGYGSIGEALERRLDGFEVERAYGWPGAARDGACTAWTSCPACCPLADVVVLLVPAHPATRAWSTPPSWPG